MNNKNENTTLLPKISVIMPVYNTAKYLKEALNSICNQSLKELELIIVNDGSTDDSLKIIKEYARNDYRITYHSLSNQGQGVARNIGLSYAIGKYIYFMDSDDVLSENALEECYSLCENNQLDFILFDAESFGNKVRGFNYCRKGLIIEDKIWNGYELLKLQLTKKCYLVPVYLGLYNRQYISKTFTGFPSGIIHEDHLFVFQTMIQANRIQYTSIPYFKRRVRESSTMTKRFSMKNIEGYTLVCSHILDMHKIHPEWRNIIELYLKETLNSVVWLGHSMTLIEKVETFFRFKRMKLNKYVKFTNWLKFWLKKS